MLEILIVIAVVVLGTLIAVGRWLADEAHDTHSGY
jgi:hypothetical protein